MDGSNGHPLLTAELASAYYTKARDELIERIRLRDGALAIYITAASAAAAVFVAGIGRDAAHNSELWLRFGSYLLLLIPIFARATALVISQHHVLIGAIEAYLVTAFGPAVREMTVALPQWDESDEVLDLKPYSIGTRSSGHGLLLILPSFLAVVAFLATQYSTGILPKAIDWLDRVSTTVAQAAGQILANQVPDLALLKMPNSLMESVAPAASIAGLLLGSWLTWGVWQSIARATRDRKKFLRQIRQARQVA